MIINLSDSESSLFIFGESDDSLTFSGCIRESIGAYLGRFRIHAAGTIIHYQWNDIGRWCANIEHESVDGNVKIIMCNPDDPNETDFENMVPTVIIAECVSAVMIEALSLGGKIQSLQYLVNDKLRLSQKKQLALDNINVILQGKINDDDLNSIKGAIYFI